MDEQKKMKAYLAPDVLLSAFVEAGSKEDREKLREIFAHAKEGHVQLTSSVWALYEAISCIKEGDAVNLDSIARIVDTVDFFADPGMQELLVKLTPERIAHLRSVAKLETKMEEKTMELKEPELCVACGNKIYGAGKDSKHPCC